MMRSIRTKWTAVSPRIPYPAKVGSPLRTTGAAYTAKTAEGRARGPAIEAPGAEALGAGDQADHRGGHDQRRGERGGGAAAAHARAQHHDDREPERQQERAGHAAGGEPVHEQPAAERQHRKQRGQEEPGLAAHPDARLVVPAQTEDGDQEGGEEDLDARRSAAWPPSSARRSSDRAPNPRSIQMPTMIAQSTTPAEDEHAAEREAVLEPEARAHAVEPRVLLAHEVRAVGVRAEAERHHLGADDHEQRAGDHRVQVPRAAEHVRAGAAR